MQLRKAWAGDAVAIALLLLAALSPHFLRVSEPTAVVVSCLTVASAVLIPFRRRFPRRVLGLSLALYIASALLGAPSSGVVLAVTVILFRVAAHTSRRTTLIAGAVAVIVILATVWALGFATGDGFDTRAIQSALTVALAGAAGDATRSRRETIESITDRAIRAEETRESEARRRVAVERLSIARDLHDAVAHQIAVISLNAGAASSAIDDRPEAARESLATIRTASREVLREIGDLRHMLRSDDSGDDDSETASPRPGFDHIDAMVEKFREAGLSVAIDISGDTSELPQPVGIVAYRIVQEALTNAHKHGSSPSARVVITVAADDLCVEVTNAASAGSARRADALIGGHGIAGIQERVASVRGTVTAGYESQLYRVVATLPTSRKTKN